MRLTVFPILALAVGCATVPPAPPITPVPSITWEQKLASMLRLEDARVLQDPNPPPAAVIVPATPSRPAVYAAPPPSDLIALLRDPEGRVRRRAALAAGRVGLPQAVPPLVGLLSDGEPEVRQMAAFAMGLIGDASARGALRAALGDSSPSVQGRAAEALGRIGVRDDAPGVAGMVFAHVQAGALRNVAVDATSDLSPAADAVRLGLGALARLGDVGALTSALVASNGQLASRWWPIAAAFQQLASPTSTSMLLGLLATQGQLTPPIAAKGLGAVKAVEAVEPLLQIVRERRPNGALLAESVRALRAIGDQRAAPAMQALVEDAAADLDLRVEALGALGAMKTASVVETLLELVTDRAPRMRAAALIALGEIDPDTLLSVLSGLDGDTDWRVRAAHATALAAVPGTAAVPQLKVLARDSDQRVVASALKALVAVKAEGIDRQLLEQLRADDVVVRAAAAAGLGELKAGGARTALADAYRAGQKDDSYVARTAALAALTAIDRQAADPVLREALSDPDWAVRVRAADLLATGLTGDALQQMHEATRAAMRPAPQRGRPSEAELTWLVNPPFSPRATVQTSAGEIELELAVLDAPHTVANFMALARKGFFNGIAVHRVVANFVVQDGDPRGDGEGGPGYTIRDEINQRAYLRGTVGMALDWRDTGGSQFFITLSPQPHLDGRYTVFGQVVRGMEVVDAIRPGDTVTMVTVWDGVSR